MSTNNKNNNSSKSKLLKDPTFEDGSALLLKNLFSVENKMAIVTGGSTGIGKMIASGLVANGCNVIICSRKKEICDDTAKEINDMYKTSKCVSIPADLSTLLGVQKFVDAIGKRKIDILVNNAGATWGAPYEDYPDEAWEKVMNLNVRHLFNLTKLLTPNLERDNHDQDPARVINIASIDGMRAEQTFGPTAAFAYTVSKGAVVHLTKALCRTLSSRNITVNCICPGVFPSQMTKFMYTSSIKDAMERNNPLKRNGRTTDMAGTVLYLCSNAGAFTNGVIMNLDGGSILHDSKL